MLYATCYTLYCALYTNVPCTINVTLCLSLFLCVYIRSAGVALFPKNPEPLWGPKKSTGTHGGVLRVMQWGSAATCHAVWSINGRA